VVKVLNPQKGSCLTSDLDRISMVALVIKHSSVPCESDPIASPLKVVSPSSHPSGFLHKVKPYGEVTLR